MALTGIDPADPTPRVAREIILGAGISNTTGTSRDVLIYGNKTSAGSETTNTIGDPIASDQDARDRAGAKSELYQMYRSYVAVDPNARIYIIAVPEGGSATAATRTFTFATTATDTGTIIIEWGGRSTSASVASGDTAITQAAAVAAAIVDADDGTWPFTAAVGAPSNDHIVTTTSSNLGDRSGFVLDGIRIRYLKSVGTTVTAGSTSAGTVADDFTSAYAEAANGTYYYQVNPKHSTTTVTATDNGIGEGIEYIKTQFLPANGKEQTMHFGLICTQAQATAVATSSAANSVHARFWHAGKASPWTPGMIAAHHAAIVRRKETDHPAPNLDGYIADDSNTYLLPAPYTNSDRLTTAEIKADLNNGVCPIRFSTSGAPEIVRHITSKSLTGSANDYRARDGHLSSAMAFFWAYLRQRYIETRQPYIADEPPQGQMPKPRTLYPSSVKQLIYSTIDQLTAATPLGLYTGPILDPSRVDEMKERTTVVRFQNGFRASSDIRAVELLHFADFELREVSGS